MDNIDNKIMPIEAISIKEEIHRPVAKTTRSTHVTGRRKRCSRGKRRNKRTHRCRRKKN
jgi:hypothetical protein